MRRYRVRWMGADVAEPCNMRRALTSRAASETRYDLKLTADILFHKYPLRPKARDQGWNIDILNRLGAFYRHGRCHARSLPDNHVLRLHAQR
jgi:hypothetical protein